MARASRAAPVVVILYHHPLFAETIKGLLGEEQTEVKLLDANASELQERLHGINPQAVVVERGLGHEATTEVAKVLAQCPGAVVLELSLEDSMMRVYRTRKVSVAQPEHLRRAVHRAVLHAHRGD